MRTFTVRDLREHTGDLIHGAEDGNLALVTKHGKPVFLAVPFNEVLLEHGLQVAVAIEVYREGVVSLEKASKIAGVNLEDFIEKLSALKIAVVDYPASELEDEMQVIKKLQKKNR